MLKRLKIWQKFTLIAVVFSFPIVVMSYYFLAETQKTVDFTSAEVDGTEYLRPLRILMNDMSSHRDLANAVLAGDRSFKPDLDKKTEEVEAGFRALEAVDARFAWQFGLTEELKEVRKGWMALKASLPTLTLQKSFDEHTRFIRLLQQFTYKLGNASNMILDPDVDSYYSVDAMIFKIPKITEEISRARAIGAALIASGGQGEENSARRGLLAEAVVRIEDSLQQQADAIRFARSFNPRTEQALSVALAENAKSVKMFTGFLADKIVNGTGEIIPLTDYYATATVPLAEGQKLWDATVVELERLLKLRVSTLNLTRYTNIAKVSLALALSILLLFVVVRAITRPIAHLRDVADKISLGDLDASIQIDTKDEIGELGDSFRRLQVSLKEAMDALERQSEGNG